MKRIKKYRLICRLTAAELQDAVNEYLDKGWHLHGPTFFANAGYRQAVVKRSKPLDYLLPRQSPPVRVM